MKKVGKPQRFYGLAFDLTRSYPPIFVALIALAAVSFPLALLIKPAQP